MGEHAIEYGRKESQLDSIRALIDTLGMQPEQAMDSLKITDSAERAYYLERLAASPAP